MSAASAHDQSRVPQAWPCVSNSCRQHAAQCRYAPLSRGSCAVSAPARIPRSRPDPTALDARLSGGGAARANRPSQRARGRASRPRRVQPVNGGQAPHRPPRSLGRAPPRIRARWRPSADRGSAVSIRPAICRKLMPRSSMRDPSGTAKSAVTRISSSCSASRCGRNITSSLKAKPVRPRSSSATARWVETFSGPKYRGERPPLRWHPGLKRPGFQGPKAFPTRSTHALPARPHHRCSHHNRCLRPARSPCGGARPAGRAELGRHSLYRCPTCDAVATPRPMHIIQNTRVLRGRSHPIMRTASQ